MSQRGQTFTTMLLSLIAIGVLLIPAYATYTIEENQAVKVFEIEGLYTNGTALEFYEPFNESTMALSYGFDVRTEYSPEANNDSLIMGFNSTGVYSSRRNGQLQDSTTYVGNGTYAVAPTWSAMPDAWFSQGRQVIIELDITGAEVSDYDWLKVSTNLTGDVRGALGIFTSSYINHNQLSETEAGVYVLPIGLTEESLLNQRPNNRVFLILGSEYVEQFATNPDFDVKVEGFNFEPADAPVFTDESYYIMSLLIADAIFLVAIAFTSQPIDLKIDRRRR